MNHNQQAVTVFNKYARLYQEKYMDVSLYAPSLDLFCKHITKKNATILEIASGPGNMTKHVLTKRPDFQLLGTDLASNMLELARANNPTAQFQLLDARHLNQLNQTFDAVLCGFVTPYLSPAENNSMISDIYDRLNPGGFFYLGTIAGQSHQSGYQTNSAGEQVYMYDYTEEDLRAMLKKNHFEELHLFRLPYLQTNDTHLIFIAQKK